MLLAAHQPVYLPWLGLFHKIAVADLFIVYDDVPYSRFGFYNRNTILGPNGPLQMSVPVVRIKTTGINHCDVAIDNTVNWRKKHWRSIQQAYRKAPFYGGFAPALADLYESEWHQLIDLNIETLKLLLGFLEIDTPIEQASTHEFAGAKSDRALDMCVKLDAEALLFGSLGRQYAHIEDFERAGIVPLFQDYVHPVYGPPKRHFRPNMSVIDLLFFHGPESRDILLAGNPTRAEYLAQAAEIKRTWELVANGH